MKVKIHAQRKFAQGAPGANNSSGAPLLTPVSGTNATLPNNNNVEKRIDNAWKSKSVVYSNLSAKSLLDQVSFQSTHNHLNIPALVRVARLPVPTNNTLHTTPETSKTEPCVTQSEDVFHTPKRIQTPRNMRLRSQSRKIVNRSSELISKKAQLQKDCSVCLYKDINNACFDKNVTFQKPPTCSNDKSKGNMSDPITVTDDVFESFYTRSISTHNKNRVKFTDDNSEHVPNTITKTTSRNGTANNTDDNPEDNTSDRNKQALQTPAVADSVDMLQNNTLIRNKHASDSSAATVTNTNSVDNTPIRIGAKKRASKISKHKKPAKTKLRRAVSLKVDENLIDKNPNKKRVIPQRNAAIPTDHNLRLKGSKKDVVTSRKLGDNGKNLEDSRPLRTAVTARRLTPPPLDTKSLNKGKSVSRRRGASPFATNAEDAELIPRKKKKLAPVNLEESRPVRNKVALLKKRKTRTNVNVKDRKVVRSKMVSRARSSTSIDFSLDDNRPLTYFANGVETPGIESSKSEITTQKTDKALRLEALKIKTARQNKSVPPKKRRPFTVVDNSRGGVFFDTVELNKWIFSLKPKDNQAKAVILEPSVPASSRDEIIVIPQNNNDPNPIPIPTLELAPSVQPSASLASTSKPCNSAAPASAIVNSTPSTSTTNSAMVSAPVPVAQSSMDLTWSVNGSASVSAPISTVQNLSSLPTMENPTEEESAPLLATTTTFQNCSVPMQSHTATVHPGPSTCFASASTSFAPVPVPPRPQPMPAPYPAPAPHPAPVPHPVPSPNPPPAADPKEVIFWDMQTPSTCSSFRYRTVMDVLTANKKELYIRCKICDHCEKINRVIDLSVLTEIRDNEGNLEGHEFIFDDESEISTDYSQYSYKELLADGVLDEGHMFLNILLDSNRAVKIIVKKLDDQYTLNTYLEDKNEDQTMSDLELSEHENLIDAITESLKSEVVLLSDRINERVREGSRSTSRSSPTPSENNFSHVTRANSENNGGQAKMSEAPVFRPTYEEFNDPIEYFERIAPIASKYGLCRVVAPLEFLPRCNMSAKLKFTVMNQYISRLYNRWGPGTRDMCAIKSTFATPHKIPLFDGVEINLTKLFQTVQRNGGLEKLITKKHWTRIANEMRLPTVRGAEKKLDQIYLKYVLPYESHSHIERQKMKTKVERAYHRRNQILLDRALNPLHRQKKLLGEADTSDDEFDLSTTDPIDTTIREIEDCVVRGKIMNIVNYVKVSGKAMEMHFPEHYPSTKDVETEYWRFVVMGNDHVCVYTASVDTSELGNGFPFLEQEEFSTHPWNLKMLIRNKKNVLRSLGPVPGLTVTTLNLGMIYSTSCWHRDPHGLPWIEYLHNGPPKIWYGIAADQSDNFRKVVESLAPISCQNKSVWLPSDVTMIPPKLILENNVPLSRTEQKAGDYVIVFPRAYSCSIATGYTISESAYFAPTSWLSTVNQVYQELRESAEPTMFGLDQLLVAIGGDISTPLTVLQSVYNTLSVIVKNEIANRKRVLEAYQTMPSTSRRRQLTAEQMESLLECEVCRQTLFLSKVVGLISHNKAVCLIHALRLLKIEPKPFDYIFALDDSYLTGLLTSIENRLLHG